MSEADMSQSRGTPAFGGLRFDSSARGDLEFRPVAEIEQLQNRLLREHIKYLAERSAFYQNAFAKHGIDPAAIRSCQDLAAVPLTTKRDLELSSRDFLCVSHQDVADYCLTSGTTGEPVAMLQTSLDLERVGFNEEVSFQAAGFTAEDLVLNAASIDRCFMAGLAYFLGLNRMGSAVLRGGSSSIDALAEITVRHRPTGIIGVPTLMHKLGHCLREQGHEPERLGVGKLVCIGEPVRNQDFSLSALGSSLADLWQARVFGTYASTEMATAFTDCEAGRGGHLHPDLVIVEIVDESGRPVPPGQPGEVVTTPLQVTGMPLLRFQTGDIAQLHDEPCACGRHTPRLGPVIGRKSQMLKYRGTTVYPPAIFSVLQEIDAVDCYYVEVFDEFELSEQIRVVVGTTDGDLKGDYVAERIAARTRVKPQIVLDTPEQVRAKTLQPGKRKPVTFFDQRRSRVDMPGDD
jgi:phenylacetate-CoA ligase